MTKAQGQEHKDIGVQRPKRRLSPLTRRVLAVNLLAPMILVMGLLYLGEYKLGLYESGTQALQVQAQLVATAMAEGAVWPISDLGGEGDESLGPTVAAYGLAVSPAAQIVRRSLAALKVRARVFDAQGRLILDSADMPGRARVQVAELPPPEGAPAPPSPTFRDLYEAVEDLFQVDQYLPVYWESPDPSADDYEETYSALDGEPMARVWRLRSGGRLLLAAVPIQYTKEVVGALLLSRDGAEIERTLYDVHVTILKLFVLGLAVTVVLSIYLAGTITDPLVRLAAAAQRIRSGSGRHPVGPGLTHRKDEIGELAQSLTEMTEALWDRLDAIESFAADVSHEIKNPLTSLKSAVETAAKITDRDQLQKLLNVIQDDVERLDRLLTDISDASRLDAELSRADTEAVDLVALFNVLSELHAASHPDVTLTVNADDDAVLTVQGREGRLVQVFRNLIGNAVSFSPKGGTITLHAFIEGQSVRVDVDDEGPGLPEGKQEDIFARFYSDRPKGEKFGSHSGLGLSISRQIVAAYHGTLTAQNRTDDKGGILGARFTVRLLRG